MCQGKLNKAFIIPISSRALKHCIRAIIFVMISAMTFGSMTMTGTAREKLRTIVIDPGHGGGDHGITGPTKIMEKNVSLIVAELILKELKGKYRVVLTRTGDYGLSLYERTAIANNHNADLFISIHAGGSFPRQTKGFHIYYYKKASINGNYTSKDLPDPESFPAAMTPWEGCQIIHVPSSKFAAETIFTRLSEPFLSADLPLKVNIQGSPLAVLSGADMPALFMEIGYLTNPQEEKNLSRKKYLSEITNKICRGIEDFFQKKEG